MPGDYDKLFRDVISVRAKNPVVKYGMYTKAAIEERKMINQLLLQARDTITEIK